MNKTILIFLFICCEMLFAQNNALNFDGSNDYVSCGTSLSVSGELTVSAWVKSAGVTGNDYIVTKGHDNNLINSFGIALSAPTNTYAIMMYKTAEASVEWATSPAGSIETNTWYHIAGVISGSNVYIYINGILSGTNTITGSISSSLLNLNIGNQDRSGYEYYFNGLIDEVQIWDIALSTAQIRQYMYQELNGNESNLAAYYKFNETSGTTADDVTANNNNGNLNNMTNDDWLPSAAFFGPKNCLDFDGTDDYILMPDMAETASGTIEMWILPDATGAENPIYGNGSEGNLSMALRVTSGYQLRFSAFDGSWHEIYSSLNTISTTEWTHVAATWNGSSAGVYVNGVFQKSENCGSISTFSGNCHLGGSTISGLMDYFSGKIDEFRFWDDVRSETEIRQNMCNTLTGNEDNLVAYYNFDNSSGTTLQDFSGDGNNGTLTNMADEDWTASSAFNTWLNTSSTTWSTAANWSNGVPSSGANLGIYNFTNEPDIPASQTFGSLYLGSGIGTTLSAAMTVNGSLILDKDFDLNGQTITLGSAATLVEGTGRLYGSSGTITTTRSLSNINENVGGLGAEITTSANLGSTTITRSHAAPGSQAIERKYYINPTTNTGLNATLVFHYNDNELNSQTESELKLFKSADGSNWTEQSSSSVNTTDNTITLTGIGAFSYWTAAPTGSDQSLPVELTSFTATNQNGGILLEWTTESEIENLGFILEKKNQETGNWVEIASYLTDPALEGHGSTTGKQDYQYVDNMVQPGLTYKYRLADVDFSGKVNKHKTVEIQVETEASNFPETFQLQGAYPNPFNPVTQFQYYLPEESRVILTIYDLNGRLIETLSDQHTPAGIHRITWDATKQTSGIYLYMLQTGGIQKTGKCILMK